LTRAIQTAQTIFDGTVPIEVRDGHHELLKFSGDVGRSPKELSIDFPELSFEHLPQRWWHSEDVEMDVPKEPEHIFKARVAGFVSKLAEIGDEQVAIIGHNLGGLSERLFERVSGVVGWFVHSSSSSDYRLLTKYRI
jgi:broad specificity phosphatase PhoE